MSLEQGRIIGGCRIEALIARGGMGEVYRATQLSLERPVALKVVSPELSVDPAFVERFRHEARASAAIEHPNILPVYETGETEDGLVYLVMRLVRGRDLGALLQDRGRLTPEEVVAVLTPIADALDAAHAAGLVHRDVKPANVLLEERSDGALTPLLMDFGLAKHTSASDGHTRTGNVIGTADYMAPEQAHGDTTLDGRVDVYAFGCMLYACLTGDVPYARPTAMATLMAHVNEPIPVPSAVAPDVPEVLDRVVERSMAKDPASRATSAGSLMRWASTQLGADPAATVPLAQAAGLAQTDHQTHTKPAIAVAVTLLLGLSWTGAYLLGATL